MENFDAAVRLELANLRAEYLKALPNEIQQISELAQALQADTRCNATLNTLHLRLHKLAGAGGSFGLNQLSSEARELEKQVRAWVKEGTTQIEKSTLQQFSADIGKLIETLVEAENDDWLSLPQ